MDVPNNLLTRDNQISMILFALHNITSLLFTKRNHAGPSGSLLTYLRLQFGLRLVTEILLRHFLLSATNHINSGKAAE